MLTKLASIRCSLNPEMYLLCCSKLPIIVKDLLHYYFRFNIKIEAKSQVRGTSTSQNQLRFYKMDRHSLSEGCQRRQSYRQGAKGSILKLQSGCWLNLAMKGRWVPKLSQSIVGQIRSNSSLSCLRTSSIILSLFSLKILCRLDLRTSFWRLTLISLSLVSLRISLQRESDNFNTQAVMQPTNPSSMTIDPSPGIGAKTSNQTSQPSNPESNPRRAATRLKEKQLQIQIMRNRFKVIQGHDQYVKYRTLDQERKIDHHNSVHSRLVRDKQSLNKSLAEVQETSQMRKRNKELRESIREGVRVARKSLLENRYERSQGISQELKEYEKKIQEIRKEDWQANKDRSSEVKKEEQIQREKVRKHQEQKIMLTILNKSKDSRVLSREANALDQEYQLMMDYQQKLLDQNSRSLQTSRLVKGRYDQLMTGQGSPRLPPLPKDRKATTTANSELQLQ